MDGIMNKPKPNNCIVKFYCNIHSKEQCNYYKQAKDRTFHHHRAKDLTLCAYNENSECTSSLASTNIMYRMIKFLFKKK